jgi:C4-dicarboxylate-specific signal transduction histidine kinase
MGQLTASIAHEVNHPITAALANAQTAELWLAIRPPEMEEAQQALDRTVKNVIHAGNVIGRIREFIKKSAATAEQRGHQRGD